MECFVIFGCHAFMPISWARTKQTAVSHSNTGAEVVSFDAGLRMEGLFAPTFLDAVIDV